MHVSNSLVNTVLWIAAKILPAVAMCVLMVEQEDFNLSRREFMSPHNGDFSHL